jgi:hypothetical protein
LFMASILFFWGRSAPSRHPPDDERAPVFQWQHTTRLATRRKQAVISH